LFEGRHPADGWRVVDTTELSPEARGVRSIWRIELACRPDTAKNSPMRTPTCKGPNSCLVAQRGRTYREKTTAVGLTNRAGVFATFASSFRTCQNHSETRADVAQPVEQRFRKLPRSIQPAITKNQAKRRIDGRQAPNPSPRTPVPLYAYAVRSHRGFFWLAELVAAAQSRE